VIDLTVDNAGLEQAQPDTAGYNRAGGISGDTDTSGDAMPTGGSA